MPFAPPGSVQTALTADWRGTPSGGYTIAIRRTLDGLYLDFGSNLFSGTPGTKYLTFPESPAGSGHFLYTIAGVAVPNFTATIPNPIGTSWYPGDLCVEVWDSKQSVYRDALAATISPAGNDQTYFGGGGGGGSDPWATATTDATTGTFGALVVATNALVVAVKAQTDKISFDVHSNVNANAVALPSPAPSGYGGSGSGSGDPWATATAAYAAGTFGNLVGSAIPASIAACSTPATPQAINLTQALTSRKDWTVGGALNGSHMASFGKWIRDRVLNRLKGYDASNQSVPLVTFDLDDPDNPTTRTPE